MDEMIKTFLFTIAGSILGSITTVIVTLISKKEETKNSYNEMILKSAIENWNGGLQVLKARGRGKIPPFDAYVISAAALYEKIDFKNINKDKLKKALEEVDEINKTITEFYEEKFKKETKNEDKNNWNLTKASTL